MPKAEKTYPLNLTLSQLWTLSEQIQAASDHDQRSAEDTELIDLIIATHKAARASASRSPKAVSRSTLATPKVIVETKLARTNGGAAQELWIEGGHGGVHPFALDCGWDGKGGKQFIELPRYFSSLRGAKHSAALLTGEKLIWTVPGNTAE